MPRVSVGILTFNRREAVLKAIQSAYDQGLDDLEVVVVDSASSDGTSEAIRERFPEVKLIRLPRNLGCPGGRNHVFANCTGEFVVNVDDDGFLAGGAIDEVVRVFQSDPKIGIVAMRQRFVGEEDGERVVGGGREDVGNFFGGVSAQRRSMLEEVGCYPEDFFLFGEETFMALRAMDAGYRIVSAPDAVMWHPRVGSSAGTRWDYYRFRNRMLLVTRLFPVWLMTKYLLLRVGSQLVSALGRGTLHKYIAAVASVFFSLPATLWTRQAVQAATVHRYFKLR